MSRGQKPAQAIRDPTDGKRLMSVPISAMRTRAIVSLIRGMVVKRLTAARQGPSALRARFNRRDGGLERVDAGQVQ